MHSVGSYLNCPQQRRLTFDNYGGVKHLARQTNPLMPPLEQFRRFVDGSSEVPDRWGLRQAIRPHDSFLGLFLAGEACLAWQPAVENADGRTSYPTLTVYAEPKWIPVLRAALIWRQVMDPDTSVVEGDLRLGPVERLASYARGDRHGMELTCAMACGFKTTEAVPSHLRPAIVVENVGRAILLSFPADEE